jgi:hypothetical protein
MENKVETTERKKNVRTIKVKVTWSQDRIALSTTYKQEW